MKVASFYCFLDLAEPAILREELLRLCRERSLLGTILVAEEGLNGTLAGSGGDIQQILDWLQRELGLDAPLDARWTDSETAPFRHLRVRLKKEIVTLGRPDLKPHERSGTYVGADEWNGLLDDPNVLVIDTRNHYEHEVGSFPGAIDPGTDSFREFPAFAARLAQTSKDRPLAMFCTGGIRCEKATALMLELGFEEVYHLKGGILNYLKDTPAAENRWDGECFIFDTRVALDKDLADGGYVQCHACRRPLSNEDLRSPDYREGVSCPKCCGELEDERAARLEERRKQVALATLRGEKHIGPRS
ncbi:MAG TPA: rhodanese-related sulfurtransferase [Woeseiaceae bacterium]|nr:rhodanese-related sulfurtransferase [Woeseiaceae bacterium]